MKSLGVLIGGVIFSSYAYCRPSFPNEIQNILNQPTRPSVRQLIDAFPKWPSENPFPSDPPDHSTLDELKHIGNPEITVPVAAKVIAALEVAFPNSTFVTIGRDSDYFADCAEAYFIAKNEGQRLIRVGVSTGSIPTGLYADEVRNYRDVRVFDQTGYSLMRNFLDAQGIDPGLAGSPNRFIILDSTSYSEESQARTLLQALYRLYAKRGGDPKDLVRKINVVNIDGDLQGRLGSAAQPQELFPRRNFDLNNFFDELEMSVSIEGPSRIIKVNGRVLTYHPHWHEKWGAVRSTPSGVFAKPGPLYSVEARLDILHNMYEVIRRIRNPQFSKAVDREIQRIRATSPSSLLPCGRFLSKKRA